MDTSEIDPTMAKRNADFHALFRAIPATETLIEGRARFSVSDYVHIASSHPCCYRLYMCTSKGHFGARPTVRDRALCVFLLKHIWLGDKCRHSLAASLS